MRRQEWFFFFYLVYLGCGGRFKLEQRQMLVVTATGWLKCG